jgi:hypothetical protein
VAEWLVWDITDTVADWASGGAENDGVLLKLVDEQEDPGVGGPAMPKLELHRPGGAPATGGVADDLEGRHPRDVAASGIAVQTSGSCGEICEMP